MARRLPTAAGAALLAALLSGAGCKQPPPPPPPPPVVEVAAVEERDVPLIREWIGTLDGSVHAHVHPQVRGYLVSRSYREGTPVKKGDPMFEIDPRPFQAALDQAQAKVGKSELDVSRLRPLAQENAVSREELDDAVQAWLGDKAAAEQARLNLEFTRVVSPIDGLAGLAKAEIGDLVGPDTEELTTVTSIDPIKVYFIVSEQDYLQSMRRYAEQAATQEPGGEAPFELLLADGSLYGEKGRFYAADNQADPATGSLRMEALFPNRGITLRPGLSARVRLTQVRPRARVVPQRAITELQGVYQAAVVGTDNRVHVRIVQPGERSGSLWIVEHGLEPSERVIAEGVQKAGDGATVNPKPYEGSQTNAPPAR